MTCNQKMFDQKLNFGGTKPIDEKDMTKFEPLQSNEDSTYLIGKNNPLCGRGKKGLTEEINFPWRSSAVNIETLSDACFLPPYACIPRDSELKPASKHHSVVVINEILSILTSAVQAITQQLNQAVHDCVIDFMKMHVQYKTCDLALNSEQVKNRVNISQDDFRMCFSKCWKKACILNMEMERLRNFYEHILKLKIQLLRKSYGHILNFEKEPIRNYYEKSDFVVLFYCNDHILLLHLIDEVVGKNQDNCLWHLDLFVTGRNPNFRNLIFSSLEIEPIFQFNKVTDFSILFNFFYFVRLKVFSIIATMIVYKLLIDMVNSILKVLQQREIRKNFVALCSMEQLVYDELIMWHTWHMSVPFRWTNSFGHGYHLQLTEIVKSYLDGEGKQQETKKSKTISCLLEEMDNGHDGIEMCEEYKHRKDKECMIPTLSLQKIHGHQLQLTVVGDKIKEAKHEKAVLYAEDRENEIENCKKNKSSSHSLSNKSHSGNGNNIALDSSTKRSSKSLLDCPESKVLTFEENNQVKLPNTCHVLDRNIEKYSQVGISGNDPVLDPDTTDDESLYYDGCDSESSEEETGLWCFSPISKMKHWFTRWNKVRSGKKRKKPKKSHLDERSNSDSENEIEEDLYELINDEANTRTLNENLRSLGTPRDCERKAKDTFERREENFSSNFSSAYNSETDRTEVMSGGSYRVFSLPIVHSGDNYQHETKESSFPSPPSDKIKDNKSLQIPATCRLKNSIDLECAEERMPHRMEVTYGLKRQISTLNMVNDLKDKFDMNIDDDEDFMHHYGHQNRENSSFFGMNNAYLESVQCDSGFISLTPVAESKSEKTDKKDKGNFLRGIFSPQHGINFHQNIAAFPLTGFVKGSQGRRNGPARGRNRNTNSDNNENDTSSCMSGLHSGSNTSITKSNQNASLETDGNGSTCSMHSACSSIDELDGPKGATGSDPAAVANSNKQELQKDNNHGATNQFDPLAEGVNTLGAYFASYVYNGKILSVDEKMRYEWLRLQTFEDFPVSAPVSAIVLANDGFYSCRIRDRVQCFSCLLVYEGFRFGDRPREMHRQKSQSCRMVLGTDESNIPISMTNQTTELGATAKPPSRDNIQGPQNHSLPSSQNHVLDQATTADCQVNLDYRQPSTSMQRSLVTTDQAPSTFTYHMSAQQRQQDARPMTSIQGGGDRAEDLGITLDRPKYPAYAQLNIRVSTFQGWPDYLDQSPRDMALAGFFYAGYNDYCRCFYCGGGLRNWDAGDDPWVEHARWFNKCAFVIQNRGKRFVEIIEKRQAEMQGSNDGSNRQISDSNVHVHQPSISTPAITEGSQQRQTASASKNKTVTSASKTSSNPALANLGSLPRSMQSSIETIGELGYSVDIILKAVDILKQNNPGKELFESTEILEAVFLVEEGREDTVTQAMGTEPPNNSAGQNQEQVPETGRSGESENNIVSLPSLSINSLENKPGATGRSSDALSSTRQREITESEIKSLQEENLQLKEQVMCKICMDKNVSIAFLPCGHLACCIDCAPAMRKCPMCRVFIKGTVKTYLA